MRARAWRLRRAEIDLAPIGDATPPPLPPPERNVISPVGIDFGCARAMEWRVAAGTTEGPGPATVWTRLLITPR
ncbi:MAG: hypothetical protein ACRDTM_02140 [Micromonosporaceae bacterium]